MLWIVTQAGVVVFATTNYPMALTEAADAHAAEPTEVVEIIQADGNVVVTIPAEEA